MKKITLGELLAAAGDSWETFPGMGSDHKFTFEFTTPEARTAFLEANFQGNAVEVVMPGGLTVVLSTSRIEPPGKLILSGPKLLPGSATYTQVAYPGPGGVTDSAVVAFIQAQSPKAPTADQIGEHFGIHAIDEQMKWKSFLGQLHRLSAPDGPLDRITSAEAGEHDSLMHYRPKPGSQRVRQVILQALREPIATFRSYSYLLNQVIEAGLTVDSIQAVLGDLQREGLVVINNSMYALREA